MAGKTSIIDDSKIERAVAKATITVGGVERKVSKIMQTVDGVWRNVYSSGIVLKYTGTTNLGTNRSYEFDDGTIALKFITDGTLTVVDGEATIEACLVGGGYKGTHGAYEDTEGWPPGNYNHWHYGEPGGNGGFVYNTPTISIKAGDSFKITVGGQAADTTAFGYSSSSGTQRTGDGQDGFYAFNDSTFDGVLYAPAGGYGSSWHSANDDPVQRDSYETTGGSDGGGTGSTNVDSPGSNATGYGGGGGGGTGRKDGGYGHSGIGIIRSKKEAA